MGRRLLWGWGGQGRDGFLVSLKSHPCGSYHPCEISSEMREFLTGENGLPGHGTPLSYPGGGGSPWGQEHSSSQVDFSHFLGAREMPQLVSFGLPEEHKGLFWPRAIGREGTEGPILPQSSKPS